MNNNLGNYVGPYWSDGKIQESVEWGESEPQHELDALARQHDSAYARYKDRAHREAADAIFAKEARKLEGKFPGISANLVQYGNFAGRQASEMLSDSKYGPLGLVYNGAKNIWRIQQKLNGTYLKKETQDILDYYKTDPKQKKALPVLPRSQHPLSVTNVGAGSVPKPQVEARGKAAHDVGGGASVSTRPLNVVHPEKPKNSGPTEKDLRAQILIAKQRNNLENFKALHQAAQRNSDRQVEEQTWSPIGYQGRRHKIQKQMMSVKKKKKKNSIQPVCM